MTANENWSKGDYVPLFSDNENQANLQRLEILIASKNCLSNLFTG